MHHSKLRLVKKTKRKFETQFNMAFRQSQQCYIQATILDAWPTVNSSDVVKNFPIQLFHRYSQQEVVFEGALITITPVLRYNHNCFKI